MEYFFEVKCGWKSATDMCNIMPASLKDKAFDFFPPEFTSQLKNDGYGLRPIPNKDGTDVKCLRGFLMIS